MPRISSTLCALRVAMMNVVMPREDGGCLPRARATAIGQQQFREKREADAATNHIALRQQQGRSRIWRGFFFFPPPPTPKKKIREKRGARRQPPEKPAGFPP